MDDFYFPVAEIYDQVNRAHYNGETGLHAERLAAQARGLYA